MEKEQRRQNEKKCESKWHEDAREGKQAQGDRKDNRKRMK